MSNAPATLQSRTLLEQIRRRLPCYLEPSVALCAGMDMGSLQKTIAGTFTPSAAQQNALMLRLRLNQFPAT